MVCKLNGVTDYIHFGQTSKRMKQLLLSSPLPTTDNNGNNSDMIKDMIQMRLRSYQNGKNDDDSNNNTKEDEDDDDSESSDDSNSRSSSNRDTSNESSPSDKSNILDFPTNDITTLKQLLIYETICDAGFGNDNRIGFDFASTEINRNDGSRQRIDQIAKIYKRFPAVHLQIDAHCGIAAPIGIAPRFSRLRGIVVRETIARAILGLPIDDVAAEEDDSRTGIRYDYDNRVLTHGWGRTLAAAAARSEHPFNETARDGKGWVDIFFRIPTDDNEFLELPSRPDYYNGISGQDIEREENRVLHALWRNLHNESDDEVSSEEDE